MILVWGWDGLPLPLWVSLMAFVPVWATPEATVPTALLLETQAVPTSTEGSGTMLTAPSAGPASAAMTIAASPKEDADHFDFDRKLLIVMFMFFVLALIPTISLMHATLRKCVQKFGCRCRPTGDERRRQSGS